jgi:hypothetical protein
MTLSIFAWSMAGAMVATLAAQAPGSLDAEGNRYFGNGTGRYPLKRKGMWKTGALNVVPSVEGAPRATPAEIQLATATLGKVSALFKATPEANQLIGYWVNEPLRLEHPSKWMFPPETAFARAPLTYETRMFPFYLEDQLKNGQYIPVFGGETDSIAFTFNKQPGTLDRPEIASEETATGYKRKLYPAPRVTGMFHGFPVYEDRELVIARPDRSPWMPAPYGQALKMALPLFQKDRDNAESQLQRLKKEHEETLSPAYEQQMRDHLEKYSGQFKTSDPKKWQGRVAGMERELKYNRELAAKKANPQRDADGAWYWNRIDAFADAQKRIAELTPESSKAPSCFLTAEKQAAAGRVFMRGTIAPLGQDPKCEALVFDNPRYFDPQLSRAEPQLLTAGVGRCLKREPNGQFVTVSPLRPEQPNHGCARHPVLWEQLDWNALAALVQKPSPR